MTDIEDFEVIPSDDGHKLNKIAAELADILIEHDVTFGEAFTILHLLVFPIALKADKDGEFHNMFGVPDTDDIFKIKTVIEKVVGGKNGGN